MNWQKTVFYGASAVFAWWVWLNVAHGIVSYTTPLDDSDRSHSVRSGLGVKTDHMTGCQYLVTKWGGITPRLDGAGRQVCRKDGRS